jgi:hypothetical protein
MWCPILNAQGPSWISKTRASPWATHIFKQNRSWGTQNACFVELPYICMKEKCRLTSDLTISCDMTTAKRTDSVQEKILKQRRNETTSSSTKPMLTALPMTKRKLRERKTTRWIQEWWWRQNCNPIDVETKKVKTKLSQKFGWNQTFGIFRTLDKKRFWMNTTPIQCFEV